MDSVEILIKLLARCELLKVLSSLEKRIGQEQVKNFCNLDAERLTSESLLVILGKLGYPVEDFVSNPTLLKKEN